MPAQFAALRHAAPVAPRRRNQTSGSPKNWSINDLLREADRQPGFCNHVERPQRPTWLLGSAAEVGRRAVEWHAQATKSNGDRALRTSPALSAAVVSLPRDLPFWGAYRDAAIRHLQAEYGDRVVGAVEHLDEEHPHLHVFMVPRDREPFGAVHPGYAASRLARKGDNKVSVAFKQAMSSWGDRLYEAVSRGFGLLRYGPRRMRMERPVWKKNKEAEKRLARALEREEEAARVVTEAQKLRRRTLEEADALIRAAKRERAKVENERRHLVDAVRHHEKLKERNGDNYTAELEARVNKLSGELNSKEVELDSYRTREQFRAEAKGKRGEAKAESKT